MLSTTYKNRAHRTGFTLIEIIVVVVIMTVLATLIVPKLFARVGQAKQAAAKADAVAIELQVNLFTLDVGLTSPDDDFDLEVLILSPDDGGGPSGPYLSSGDLVDPWGTPFEIVMPGSDQRAFDIISWGEDKEPGGEGLNEDITSAK